MKNSIVSKTDYNHFFSNSIFQDGTVDLTPDQTRIISKLITDIMDHYSFDSIIDAANNMYKAPEIMVELEQYLTEEGFTFEYDVDITNFIPVSVIIKKNKNTMTIYFANETLLSIDNTISKFMNAKEVIEKGYTNLWDKEVTGRILASTAYGNLYDNTPIISSLSFKDSVIKNMFGGDEERITYNFLCAKILIKKLEYELTINHNTAIEEGIVIIEEIINAYKKFYRIIDKMKNTIINIIETIKN